MLNLIDNLIHHFEESKSVITASNHQTNQPNKENSIENSEKLQTKQLTKHINIAINKINNEILNKHLLQIIKYFQENVIDYKQLSNMTAKQFAINISNWCEDKKLIKPLKELYKLVSKHNEGIIFEKTTNFGEWYREIVTKCDLIDYTDISGCYVLKPLSYFIWKQIKSYMDKHITSLGVDEAYFPLFATEKSLKKESEFFDAFSAEVAWITHCGKDYSQKKYELSEKFAIRPTSESIIYPMFSKWIKSHKQLPYKVNQWCNVVRWEFDNPTPFLRSREFLWQEGHTAYSDLKEAEKEVDVILDLYANTYKNMCAVPTIKGTKTKHETFPGADYSRTVECFISGSGRAIQGATSHHLGQRFSKGVSAEERHADENKMTSDSEKNHKKNSFDIKYLDKDKTWKYVYQNSWGFTTRSIGVMILSHSDNKGLVLPPKVAKIQIVIFAVNKSKNLKDKCVEIYERLKNNEFRVFLDDRYGVSYGYKCNEWELKGVPIRIEIGNRDIKNEQCTVVRRDMIEMKEKMRVNVDDKLEIVVGKLMEDMHNNLYCKAEQKLKDSRKTVRCWDMFLKEIQNGNIVDAPHCNEIECEKLILSESKEYFMKQVDIYGVGQTGKAKALCIPKDKEEAEITKDTVCVRCKNKATKWILFGRSY
eukprot:273761_1